MADNIREQRECQQNIEHIYSTRMSCDDILDYIVPKKKNWVIIGSLSSHKPNKKNTIQKYNN